jgi:hypothetical protein
MQIPKYTFGVGDRFGHQGQAQLKAFLAAREQGIDVYPVWNKSNREHNLIGSNPEDVRVEAKEAIESLGWKGAYFVDADHINLKTVDRFIEASDFYTLDVADDVGKPSSVQATEHFLAIVQPYLGLLTIPGISAPFAISRELAKATADKFLFAIQTAGQIYRHVESRKGLGRFVTEISVDETDKPQTPVELFLILAMIAEEKIPLQTIAPKFTGRFNKGVDYTGDLAQFEKEFEEDLHVLAFSIRKFGLPGDLKLSVHSGSDKFSLYPIIRKLIQKHNVGLHVKTAGTTWLEELIGLAESGGEGLVIAKEIYVGALGQFAELTQPYASVIAIDTRQLPSAGEVSAWNSDKFVRTLRHDPTCLDYNSHFRQLLHVSFKLAAKMGSRYTKALEANQIIIERNVKENLWERHIQPIFGQKR